MKAGYAALAAFLAAAALAGCGRDTGHRKDFSDETTKVDLRAPPAMRAPPRGRAAAPASMPDSVSKPPAPGQPVTPDLPPATPMLAYTYVFGIEAPAGNIRALETRQEAACAAAGATQCQVTSSNVQEVGDGLVTGQLALRATPAWLDGFKAGMADDAKAAGGRVKDTNVRSEDLSRQIVDTEAALRARTTLRDRLLSLLANHPGNLADLLTVERELATVQGEIDATQSELVMMQARVAMSEVTISYRPTNGVASRGVWSPVSEAWDDVFSILAGTLGFVIRLVAVLAVWVLIFGGGYWLLSRRFPGMAFWRRKPPAPPAQPS